MTEMKSSRLIVVLGMHRSGTSAITKSLELLGVGLGTDLYPADFDNPKGFWEDNECIGINEALLKHLGSAYDRLALAWDEVRTDSQVSELKLRATQHLSKKLVENNGIWGFKDPRTCRLFGFWNEVFLAVKCDVSFVIAVRNPASVTASLAARNSTPVGKAYFLWLQHVLPSLSFVKGARSVVVDYDEILANPYSQIVRISSNLGLPLPGRQSSLVRDFENKFLDTELRHTSFTEAELALDNRAPKMVAVTYNLLHRLAKDQEALESPSIQDTLNELTLRLNESSPAFDYINILEDERVRLWQAVAERDGQIVSLNDALAERNGQITNLKESVVERNAQLASLNEAITERDGQIVSLNDALAERNGQITNLTQIFDERERRSTDRLAAIVSKLAQEKSDRDREIASLNGALAERDRQIITFFAERNHILDSTSWKITKPLRFIRRIVASNQHALVSTLLKKHLNYGGAILFDGAMGNLEFPRLKTSGERNILNVSGWVFATQSPLVKLYAIIDGNELPLVHGYERPDVSLLFPEQEGALKCGFSGIVFLQSKAREMVRLDIWAEFQDGSKAKCFSRRVTHRSISAHRLPPLKMLMFLGTAIRKAWHAYKQGRLPMSPSQLWRALQRNYIWTVGIEQRHLMSQATHRISIIQDPYQQWIETNRITAKLRTLMAFDAQRLAASTGVTISLVVPVYNTPRQFLEEMIQSVLAQFYQNWELCLVDDASTMPHVREVLDAAAKSDSRIRVQFRSTNGHICVATNDALHIAAGDFVALLDHDDTLPPDALLHVAECVYEHPEVDWIYTDEDKIDEAGRRYDPQFKGAWSPEMAITHNYTHHLTVIRKDLVAKVGSMRQGFEGAQDLDLFLRVAENTTSARIRHIPQICYHWRSHEQSTASQGTQKTYVFDSAFQAIQEALIRRKLSAEPFLPALAKKYGMCLYQLRWKNVLREGREVTIAIPTKDRVDLLKRCVSSLRETVNWQFVRLIIVDDRSTDPATLKYLRELENDEEFKCRVIRPTKQGDGFNYARLINQAAAHVDTPYFLQLNNDVEAITPGWLEDMVGWMSVEGVGVVGARLLYPDHTVQHAGVVVGPHGGLADHQFHQLPDSSVGYLALSHAARNVSAVTGACLLTSTDLFREVGGFDEENFAVEYNDVDFCLRVIEHGKRIVCSPQATLCHLTSASRGKAYNPKEHLSFIKRYRGFNDPFFSRNILPDSMSMTINGRYATHADRIKDLNILFVGHELTLTGAPIVAYELARYFSEVMGFKISVVSLQDGPVRERFKESGISVQILTDFPNMMDMSAAGALARLKGIGADINIEAYDLVVCNTMVCYWGVLLADMFKVPSIWNIHESVGVTSYCAMFADASMRELVASSFMKANRTVFQAEATRIMYADFDVLGRFQTIPGGLSLSVIEQYRATHSKDSLRQKHGISKESQVVTLIGTTCERKGQTVFLDSIKQLESNFPTGMPDNIVFLLVGAVEGLYLDLLKKMIAQHGLKNVLLVGETKDIYDYYMLSDIFVCASYEESFPMVVLLAMAFELPIVSTNVFGIPEIVSDGHDAILVPPGNPKSMADAIHQYLIEKENAVAMANRAYAKLYRLFDNGQLHSRHADLAREVAIEDVHEALTSPPNVDHYSLADRAMVSAQ